MKRLMLILILFSLMGSVIAEDAPTYVYVTATQLNGRARPSRHGMLESLHDYGDMLEATGRWSADYKWIEVVGGEVPTVWVSAEYVTETLEPMLFVNEDYKKIKIRKHPVNGRITGYLKKGKTIEIDRILLGWGHCSKGWIDLSLLAEDDERR